MYIYTHDNDFKKADSLQHLFLIFKFYYLAFQGLNIITEELFNIRLSQRHIVSLPLKLFSQTRNKI